MWYVLLDSVETLISINLNKKQGIIDMKNSKNFLISLLVFIGLGFGNLCMADEKVFRLPMSKPAGNLKSYCL